MDTSTANLPAQPASGEDELRFAFGRNWTSFLTVLSEQRIDAAERSLQAMLRRDDLIGHSFLDAGSGSGLFSLAARRLGARVLSFDLDADAVACTAELKRRFFPGDPAWQVSQGSVLDAAFTGRLGRYDVVYSWGVLHHTGDLWRALGVAADCVAPAGQLFVGIYNDAGRRTRRWRRIKRLHARLPAALRMPYALAAGAPCVLRSWLSDIGTAGNGHPAGRPGPPLRERGMSRWHDLLDWVGGYPYQAARVDDVFDFVHRRGFTLTVLKSDSGLGCNEFVFHRTRD